MFSVGDRLGLLGDASALGVGAQPFVGVIDSPRLIAELAILATL